MTKIGFTTGCLYQSDLSYEKRINFCKEVNATAIELSFARPTFLMDFELTREMNYNLNKFAYISIHAPWIDTVYDSDSNTNKIIEKIKYLCRQITVDGIVVHPVCIKDFACLEKSKLPFVLENMDGKENFGTHPEHFMQLARKYNFGFVFDTQHAYEHDPSMNLAKELVSIMGGRLRHIHVSGQKGSIYHHPTYDSENKDAIVQILRLGINVPKISEGILPGDTGDIHEIAIKELEFIKKYEKKESS